MAKRMKEHVEAADTTPLLIFPEGTCVNNEYCVMFKRGAFDLGATVCPVAIKYNKVFVDAFWNSKRQSFTAHLVRPTINTSCHYTLAGKHGIELCTKISHFSFDKGDINLKSVLLR